MLFPITSKSFLHKLAKAKNPPIITLTNQMKIRFSSCEEDIEDMICNIRTDKACGPNSIPTKILGEFKNEPAKPLSDIINITFLMNF